MTIKDLSYGAISSISRLYLIINKTNGCIDENKANKYLTLDPTDEIKGTLETYETIWNNGMFTSIFNWCRISSITGG